MKKQITFFITAILIAVNVFGQNEGGYWDNLRGSTKTISIGAGQKNWVRVELPAGTTDLAYRITLGSSKVSESLANALGSVPEPHAQGVSAAIKLLVAVGGDDKCNYFIFLSEDGANKFYYHDNYSDACFQTYNITSDAGILSPNTCLESTPTFLYIVFKSLNRLENEKITLEVVPWVDKKASRGWTKALKEETFISLKSVFTSAGASKYMSDQETDELVGCILSKVTQKYTRQELNQVANYELKKMVMDDAKECDKDLNLNLDNRHASNEASYNNEATSSTNNNSTEFDTQDYVFGNAMHGTLVSHKFVYNNLTAYPIKVSDIHGSCSCISIDCDKSIVAPGQSRDINVTLNTTNKLGMQDKTISVSLTAGSETIVKILHLKGIVQ